MYEAPKKVFVVIEPNKYKSGKDWLWAYKTIEEIEEKYKNGIVCEYELKVQKKLNIKKEMV
jgi:hypothetical protein